MLSNVCLTLCVSLSSAVVMNRFDHLPSALCNLCLWILIFVDALSSTLMHKSCRDLRECLVEEPPAGVARVVGPLLNQPAGFPALLGSPEVHLPHIWTERLSATLSPPLFCFPLTLHPAVA